MTPTLVVYMRRRTNQPGNRVGFTVSVHIGKAVVRNRVRRRLREIYRLNESRLGRGYDMVVVARGRAAGAEYAQLERDFLCCLKKLGMLEEGAAQ